MCYVRCWVKREAEKQKWNKDAKPRKEEEVQEEEKEEEKVEELGKYHTRQKKKWDGEKEEIPN